MGYQILDVAQAMAMARVGGGPEADGDPGRVRDRLAILTWLGGLGLGLVAGSVTGRLLVLVLVLVLALIATVLVGFGPRRIVSWIRSPFPKKS